MVIGAIKWLKENNDLYADVEINENWVDEWVNSDLSYFLDNHDKGNNTHNNEANSSANDNAWTGCTKNVCISCVSTQGMQSGCDTENDMSGAKNNGLPVKEYDSQSGQDTENDIRETESNGPSVEENEFREDCVAAEKALLTTGKPTPNMLQFEQLENEIYTCALGEDNIPQYILLDDKFEVLGYPDMFPYGKGGYMTSGERTTKLSLQKYYQQRLLNVDGCFANNIEYLFCAQYVTEIKQIKDSAHIALHLKHEKTLGGGRQLPQVC